MIIALLLFSYLLGSLPSAYLIGRRQGIDLLQRGSGNLGAHNTYQVMGLGWGLLVWLIDTAKGLLAVWLAGQFSFAAAALCGLAVVIGHIWSIWALLLTGRFCVGKGVSTAGGTWVLIAPAGVAVLTISLWAGILGVGGVVPLATLTAFAVGSTWMLVLIEQGRLPLIVGIYVIGVAGMILIRHRDNIRALLAHRERHITRDLPRRALASIGLFGLVGALLSACASQAAPTPTPVAVIATPALVSFPTIVLPPTWTPAPTLTPGPTDTPLPTITPTGTLSDDQLCQAFVIIVQPQSGMTIPYDGAATFGWSGSSGDVQLTLVFTVHSTGKLAAQLEVPTPGDSIVAFPLMKLATDVDGELDWELYLHHNSVVVTNTAGTPQLGTLTPATKLCVHSGTFTRLPVQMM